LVSQAVWLQEGEKREHSAVGGGQKTRKTPIKGEKPKEMKKKNEQVKLPEMGKAGGVSR